ncbi:tRNA-specific adenosine deaminase 1 [Mortierella alpina]|nr:tRNA-specific adenosine deaminase 1 [Mortierella alpina]
MPVYRTQDLPSGVVQECHAQFARLPKHGKPSRKANGQAEWTILAGVVVATPTSVSKHALQKSDQQNDSNIGDTTDEEYWDLECISLATGSKCLPRGKQSPRGDLINDCHAEILARRGFNRWCLLEMQASVKDPKNARNRFRYTGDSISRSNVMAPLFELLDPQTQFHLYISQAPCGDATTASLALTQTEESKGAFLNGRQTRLDTGSDANAHAITPPAELGKDAENTQDKSLAGMKRRRDSLDQGGSCFSKVPRKEGAVDILVPPQLDNVTDEHGCYRVLGFRRGRIDYDSVGVLRTKPGRVDSEPTMSMSCSDKIARWNVLGLTSALVRPFIAEPLFLTSVIAGDLFDAEALERALFHRIRGCCFTDQKSAADEMARSTQQLVDHPHRVSVHKSSNVFDYSKDVVTARSEQEGILIPPVASPCSTSWIASEPAVTEVLVNGCKAGASTKKQISAKARSRLCKISMFETSAALWKSIPGTKPDLVERMIRSNSTVTPEEAKSRGVVYKDWKRLSESHRLARERLLSTSFRNWIKTDDSLEMFDIDGNSNLTGPTGH